MDIALLCVLFEAIYFTTQSDGLRLLSLRFIFSGLPEREIHLSTKMSRNHKTDGKTKQSFFENSLPVFSRNTVILLSLFIYCLK